MWFATESGNRSTKCANDHVVTQSGAARGQVLTTGHARIIYVVLCGGSALLLLQISSKQSLASAMYYTIVLMAEILASSPGHTGGGGLQYYRLYTKIIY